MSAIKQIQIRRGTAAAWTSANTVLAAGEQGFETDTGKRKTGDGTTAWTALHYDGGCLEAILLDVGDETTNLSTGTAKKTFRMPFAFRVIEVRASVNTAPTGSTVIVDINEGGVSILSTKLSIDASEFTSATAAAPAVISDAALADNAEITIDLDQVGSSVTGKGLKVVLLGRRV